MHRDGEITCSAALIKSVEMVVGLFIRTRQNRMHSSFRKQELEVVVKESESVGAIE